MYKIFLLLIIAVFWLNCTPKIKDQVRVPLKTTKILFSNWDDIFENHEIIPFTFADPKMDIYTIGSMSMNSKDEYFVLDGKAKKILHFDATGKFKQYIGREGEGPGEYTLPGCSYIDKNNNLFVYDLGKRRINKYIAPDYTFAGQFLIPTFIQDLIVDENENFIVYTTSEPRVIFKINPKGEIIKKSFSPDQEKFRVFSARFQMGRFSVMPGNLFLMSYPEQYKIYLFDYQLKLKKVFYPESHSKYFPTKAEFPGTLSPYDFTPKHSKWWGQSLRPARIFYLGNGFFVMDIIEFTNLSGKFFTNIHDLDGNTYAAGLEIPFDGTIKYARDNYIYVVEDSRMEPDNTIIPLKLHRFKIKLNIKPIHAD